MNSNHVYDYAIPLSDHELLLIDESELKEWILRYYAMESVGFLSEYLDRNAT